MCVLCVCPCIPFVYLALPVQTPVNMYYHPLIKGIKHEHQHKKQASFNTQLVAIVRVQQEKLLCRGDLEKKKRYIDTKFVFFLSEIFLKNNNEQNKIRLNAYLSKNKFKIQRKEAKRLKCSNGQQQFNTNSTNA